MNTLKIRIKRPGVEPQEFVATRAGAGVLFCRSGDGVTSRGEFGFPRDYAVDPAEWDRLYYALGGIAAYDEDGDRVF